jgi:hypothetical protein
LPGDKDFLYHAKMDSVDSTVEPGDRVRCCALLPNGEGKFMRGMKIRVRLITASPHNALLIPERAVGTDHDQKSVFIVNDRNVAERRVVKTAELDDDLRVVTEGLKAEDWVITSDLREVRPGMIVKPEKPSPPAAGPAAELKVYGGKTLDQWRELARTDLDHHTRVNSFRALGAFAGSGKSNEALTAILEALKVDQPLDALIAAYAALRLTGPQGEATIISAIGDKDAAHRLAAIRAMAFGNSSRDTYAIPALTEALDDPDPAVRQHICLALASIAVATEQGSQKDGRASRVRLEGEIGPTSKTVISVLSRLLKDADPRVRDVAVLELDQMGALPKASIPDLIAYVKGKSEEPRKHVGSERELSMALRALGQMGPAASAAIPLLTQIKQPGVKSFLIERAADDALYFIQGGKPRPHNKPDSVHPESSKPDQTPPPQAKSSPKSAEK